MAFRAGDLEFPALSGLFAGLPCRGDNFRSRI